MIFCFSASGNTLWAAKQISTATNEEIVDIPQAIRDVHYSFVLQPGERLGFAFPVHGWRPPKIVRQFISQLLIAEKRNDDSKIQVSNTNQTDNAANDAKALSHHFVYALITAGDDIGLTLDYFNQDLAHNNLPTIDSAFSILMPETYVGLPFMDVDKKKNELRKIDEAEKKIKDFMPYILARARGEFSLNLSHWPRINSNFLGDYFVNHLVSDRKFKVNRKRCIHCGLCAKVCPVDNIKMTAVAGRKSHLTKDTSEAKLSPQWLHGGRCLTCFACYHHCPAHAISFGVATIGKGQYYFGHKQ